MQAYHGSWDVIKIVAQIIEHCDKQNDFTTTVEEFAKQYNISERTLHRYFESTTSLSTKKALQILRIRKAAQQIANNPAAFNYEQYGYYDHSHFSKHLKQFLQKDTINNLQPHLKLLQNLRAEK